MNLDQFLELFNPQPANSYLHVCVDENEFSKALENKLLKYSGELKIIKYNEQNLPFSKPFRALPRSFDMVIFQDIFHKHEKQDMILKIAYTALANTADIIIMEKKGILDIEKLKEKLESFEFLATNDIDIVDGYDLVMAKKMHMWGNGL
jgi:hypothetical protein